jgi:hypothetical protein
MSNRHPPLTTSDIARRLVIFGFVVLILCSAAFLHIGQPNNTAKADGSSQRVVSPNSPTTMTTTGTVVSTDVSAATDVRPLTDEQYTVTFKWPYGFINANGRQLYFKLHGHEGATVTIKYVELYRATIPNQPNSQVSSYRVVDADLTPAH